MTDRIARGLSWGAALVCAGYIAWGCFHLRRSVLTIAQLLAGLGGELPTSTRFVIAFSSSYVWPAGALLILLVVGKELMVRNTVIRLAITVAFFVLVGWFFDFAVAAMYEPMMGILKKIG
jgi:hypothetical protein